MVPMSTIKSFRDLVAWQKAMDLADAVYTVTDRFPAREQLGLVLQMRRAAVSIPANIAEGTRHRRPGYLHHVVIALGSHAELDTQCELATRRQFVNKEQRVVLEQLLAEVGRLTHALRESLRRPITTSP